MQTSGLRRNFQLKSREYTVRSAAAGAAQHARAAMKTMIWIMLIERFYDDAYLKWRACRVPRAVHYHHQRSSIGDVQL